MNPTPSLNNLVGRLVVVNFEQGNEYRGILASLDSYQNLQLTNAQEYENGQLKATLGGVLISRYNKKLSIKLLEE